MTSYVQMPNDCVYIYNEFPICFMISIRKIFIHVFKKKKNQSFLVSRRLTQALGCLYLKHH